ncbi:MAG: GNAT family N-acetyltransferase [Neomegalonema sp.]|nr:GNAT family N-acetyltransferase [Neomegalonema sp.]
MATPSLEIRAASEVEAKACPAIEKAGAAMFAHSPYPEIAEEPTPRPDRFIAAAAEGLLLVAVFNGDAVIGFGRYELDESDLILAEFDVLPEHQGKGVGARLIEAGEEVAAARGKRRLTLTTFRDVAWNQPYYQRRGFKEIALADAGGGLRAEAEMMASFGWGPHLRLAMARPVRGGKTGSRNCDEW